LYLRAWRDLYSFERERVTRALGFLDRAIARDPLFAPALALAAHCRHVVDMGNWTDDPAANRQSALRLARKALLLSADDPVILAFAGFALGYFGEVLAPRSGSWTVP
jgi:hypothetical protein